MYSIFAVVFINILVLPVRGDPNINDWVSVEYVRHASSANSRSNTADAQNTIIYSAQSSSSHGIWSVTNGKDVLPPSGNAHDYLSWAPYHWPNCNWCTASGRTHLVHSGDGFNDTSPNNDHRSPDGASGFSKHGRSCEEGIRKRVKEDGSKPSPHDLVRHRRSDGMPRSKGFVVKRNVISTSCTACPTDAVEDIISLPQMPLGGPPPLPTPLPGDIASSPTHDPTTDSPSSTTHGPAQAAAKTTCTPSPTESLPPSATWTTCPYVVRDGRVNPDVQALNGPGAINGLSQAVIHNAIAYSLSNSTLFSRNFVHFVDAFFFDESTRMYPNMNYGQIVRGPGPDGSSGTWTGVLDMRALVKVVNGILIMKDKESPDWTMARSQLMDAWIFQYAKWLTENNLGKEVASRMNNHVSFYTSQLAAIKMYAGDLDGAATVLVNFFRSKFVVQIAQSGEQPFEAARTRPFHYRCFNLEALITNAKLGDGLGLNFWIAKSNYGATIQTAVDYAMNMDPKSEDVSELVPHVAAVAAAYGDPTGKYRKFLENTAPNYQSRSFFFYDQSIALPASRMNKHAGRADTHTIPFDCDAVLGREGKTEVDVGIFVTCEQLQLFFAL